MIVHVSIPAKQPRHVAKVLGEILGGPAVQFVPGGPEAYMAYAGDGSYLVEVLPLHSKHVPGIEEGEGIAYGKLNASAAHAYQTFHIASCTDVPYDQIMSICAREGWRCVESWRGAAFKVLEVWIENVIFFELMSKEDAARYWRTMGQSQEWCEGFDLKQEADGVYVADQDNEIVKMIQQGRVVELN